MSKATKGRKPHSPVLYSTVRNVLCGRGSLSKGNSSKVKGTPNPSPANGYSSKRFQASFHAESRNCQVGSWWELSTPEASSSVERSEKSRPASVRRKRETTNMAKSEAATTVEASRARQIFL